MVRLADRRTVLLVAGTAAIAAVVGAVPAQSDDMSGTVEFEEGALIPKGEIEIYIEGATVQDRAPETRVTSDGQSRSIGFSFSPAGLTASTTARIVARLERADGWLLARGSAKFEIDSPIHIVLRTAMY